MGWVEQRLNELGLELPADPKLPPGMTIPFQWVRIRGNRAYISGHGALAADGSPLGPFGKVPSRVSLEEAQASARSAILAMLASLKRAVGALDRVTAWLMVYGNMNADPGYPQTTLVVNPASELLLDLYGSDAGAHARTALGMSALPSTSQSSSRPKSSLPSSRSPDSVSRCGSCVRTKAKDSFRCDWSHEVSPWDYVTPSSRR